jgi:hypothetical protein
VNEQMKKEDKVIKRARVSLLEPEKVYEELIRNKEELSSKQINLDWVFGSDDKLEKELLDRNEPLIDLGLAQAAVSKEVVTALWSKYDSKDVNLSLAIKVGILGGMNASAIPTENLVKILEGEYVGKIDDEDDMAYALLKNKHARRFVIKDLLKKQAPFNHIADNRMLVLLDPLKYNECLNIDKSDSESPDLTYWAIRDGLFKIITESPVSQAWLYALYDLLGAIKGKYFKEDFNFPAFVEKWRQLGIDEPSTSDGYYTNLSFNEEFLCLSACLLGYRGFSKDLKLSESEKADVVYRCEYYSKGSLSAKQISDAIIQDGSVFIMSALYNHEILLRNDKRELIEEALSGNLVHLYNDRIKFLKQEYPWFKPQVIQESENTKDTSNNSDLGETINSFNESLKLQHSEILKLKQFIYGGAIALLIISFLRSYF